MISHIFSPCEFGSQNPVRRETQDGAGEQRGRSLSKGGTPESIGRPVPTLTLGFLCVGFRSRGTLAVGEPSSSSREPVGHPQSNSTEAEKQEVQSRGHHIVREPWPSN